ncbi:histidine decarboxylase [Actinoplanes sp. NPDC026619]|uniref:histidine decarboxylase n=1 Tax=Actinoplanes sp. NPDC026619 TaxID=3155798 RepID=UPI00340252CD
MTHHIVQRAPHTSSTDVPEVAFRAPTQNNAVDRLPPGPALHPRLISILDRLTTAAPTNIGFPAAVDIDYRPLAPFLRYMINNVGSPAEDTTYPAHAKDLERDVLAWFATLFRAPTGWTGYLTSGGTEGTMNGLLNARAAHPRATVFVSTSGHYSVPKSCALLGLPMVQIPAGPRGHLDYEALRREASRRRGQPAIVAATVGTTMTEAVDDVPQIHAALDAAGIERRWIHADAALAGIPLVLTGRHDFDLAPGAADSLSISGHKWWGTPIPCGVTLTRRPPHRPGRRVDYIGSRDTTITGSRPGLAALMLWHAITRHDLAGHRLRVDRARDVASYARRSLAAVGWECWRNPDALTVMLRPLPEPLRPRWPLPIEQGWSHLICMPGIGREHIDSLIKELGVNG